MIPLSIGVMFALNLVIIFYNVRKARYANAALCFAILVCICFLCLKTGTFSALAAGAIASFLVSIYLLWKPIGSRSNDKG